MDHKARKASGGQLINLVDEPDSEKRCEKARGESDCGDFNPADTPDGDFQSEDGYRNWKLSQQFGSLSCGSNHLQSWNQDQVIAQSKLGMGSPQGSSGSPRLTGRPKKYSLPSAALLVPSLGFERGDSDPSVDNITKQLEETVRKISRGSPNGYSWIAHYPRYAGTSPANSNNLYLSDLTNKRSGLSVLARGYEQYRESLMDLRPSTEFGEASSDDLSSEWESCSESELPPSSVPVKIVRRPSSNLCQGQSTQESGSGQRPRVSY